VEDEEDAQHHAGEACGIVPAQLFAEVENGKGRKDGKGDHFLNGLELSGGEFIGADAVRRNLEAILVE